MTWTTMTLNKNREAATWHVVQFKKRLRINK